MTGARPSIHSFLETKKSSGGLSRSAVVIVLVAALGLFGTWFVASSCGAANRIRAEKTQEIEPTQGNKHFQPPPVHRPVIPTKTERDEHFQDVLEQLASRQRQESFESIFNSNEWGNKESVSGDGSTEEYTRNARSLLARSFKEFDVKDWIDSPCGDCNWQGLVDGIDDISYLGLDIVPALIEGNQAKYVNRTNMNFKQQDFINEPFPHKPDMILCRDMIQHNSLADGVRAYYNMERSGAKYIATTWHQVGEDQIMTHNSNQPAGGMYFVNIFLHPFNFSKPEYFIREGGDQPDQKTLGLWRLPALGLGDGQYFDMPEESWLKAENEIVNVRDMKKPP